MKIAYCPFCKPVVIVAVGPFSGIPIHRTAGNVHKAHVTEIVEVIQNPNESITAWFARIIKEREKELV